MNNNISQESQTILKCSTNALFIIFSDGATDMIPWNSIQRIEVETNDTGPLGSDVWWSVSDGKRVIRIPSGATGEQEMISHFQTFHDFDNNELIKATQSTGNATFICWQQSS